VIVPPDEKVILSKSAVEPVDVRTHMPEIPGTLFTHELNCSPLVITQFEPVAIFFLF
jgi:hypothetical protein